MGKKQRDTPNFLKSQLSDDRKSMVRKEWPRWLTKEKARLGRLPEMNHELLVQFIAHLGNDDKNFRNIASKAIKTTHKGTLFIYDYMRKHLGPMDEKPATPTPARKPPTPKKSRSPEPKEAKVQIDAPIQITANNDNEFGDEKDVRYYKNIGDENDDSSAHNPSSNANQEGDGDSDDDDQLGEPEHQELKQQFIDLVDASSLEKIGWLEFTWNVMGTVTFQVHPPKPSKQ